VPSVVCDVTSMMAAFMVSVLEDVGGNAARLQCLWRHDHRRNRLEGGHPRGVRDWITRMTESRVDGRIHGAGT
jgi:hypothetical protein